MSCPLSAAEELALRSELILAYCTIEEQRAELDRLRKGTK